MVDSSNIVVTLTSIIAVVTADSRVCRLYLHEFNPHLTIYLEEYLSVNANAKSVFLTINIISDWRPAHQGDQHWNVSLLCLLHYLRFLLHAQSLHWSHH